MRLGEKAGREVAEQTIQLYVNNGRPCPRSTVVQLLTKRGKEVTGNPSGGSGIAPPSEMAGGKGGIPNKNLVLPIHPIR